jgi:hypothetical protein
MPLLSLRRSSRRAVGTVYLFWRSPNEVSELYVVKWDSDNVEIPKLADDIRTIVRR